MTNVAYREARCAACGETSLQYAFVSTHQSGSPDLDSRPPEQRRSILHTEIEACPGCGYAARRIGTASPPAIATSCTEGYRRLLAAASRPLLSRYVRAAARIALEEGELPLSGHLSLRAAWTCDDALDDEGAREARREAYRSHEAARQRGLAFAGEWEDVLLVDLLRRVGDWDAARGVAERAVPLATDPRRASALSFELERIEARDDGCHRLSNALEGTRSGPARTRRARTPWRLLEGIATFLIVAFFSPFVLLFALARLWGSRAGGASRSGDPAPSEWRGACADRLANTPGRPRPSSPAVQESRGAGR